LGTHFFAPDKQYSVIPADYGSCGHFRPANPFAPSEAADKVGVLRPAIIP